ncbi:hypothetical protein BH23CHL2_BH23CHL2_15950 [soil metagenome]
MDSIPDSDNRATRTPGARTGQDLLAELGWPLDTEIIVHQDPVTTIEGKKGPIRASADIFFTPMAEGTDDDKGIEFYMNDGSTKWGLLLLFRVRPIGVPAVFERRYRYKQEPYDIIRLSGASPTRAEDRAAIMTAIWAVLPFVQQVETRGRKRLEDEPYQDWRDIMRRILHLRRSGRFTSEKAAAFNQGVPYGTFRRWKSRVESESG